MLTKNVAVTSYSLVSVSLHFFLLQSFLPFHYILLLSQGQISRAPWLCAHLSVTGTRGETAAEGDHGPAQDGPSVGGLRLGCHQKVHLFLLLSTGSQD